MKKCKVSAGLGGLSDVELSEKAAVVIASMDGNTSFLTPFPTIPNITTLKDNYDAALAKADHGSVYSNAIKNELRDNLKEALLMLAAYVQTNCQNNEAIAISSGFGLRKSPEKFLPETPADLRVAVGVLRGEVVVSFKKVPHALGYIIRYTDDLNSGVWTETQVFTKSKRTISGLTRGKDVWVEVRSFNANGISDWSSPSFEMVR